MLTAKERRQVLVFLQYVSKMNFFPIQVDPQGWEIGAGCKNKLKAWACKLALVLFAAHALYKNCALIYVILILTGTPLHQLLFHGILAAGSVVFISWQFVLYWQSPDLTAAFWKISLNGVSETGIKGQSRLRARLITNDLIFVTIVTTVSETSSNPDGSETKAWYSRLAHRSLQDLIAIYLPHMLSSSGVAIAACFILDPTMNLLLYSALPVNYQNWFTFGICFLEEIRFLGTIIATAAPVWQFQIMAFDMISSNLEHVVKSMQMS